MAVVHARRRYLTLGAFDQAAWDAYQASGKYGAWSGPPNGSIEDPNGGVIHFDANGNQESYSPPATFAASPTTGLYSTDSVVENNPSSTFYGWTEIEKAAFNRGAYGQLGIVTDMIRNAPHLPDGSVDPRIVAASDANLLSISQSDPKVAAAVAIIKGGGTFRGEQQSAFDAQQAATITANASATATDANRALAGILASGGVFADTIKPGGYTAAFLTGMLTTVQWVEDWIAVANGGVPTNSNLMKGRLPVLPAGVYIIGSSSDPHQGLTSPSTGASMLSTANEPTRGTNPDGSQVVWNEGAQRWDPVDNGNSFAAANAGSAGGNYLPGGGSSFPGGSSEGGGGLTLPGGLSLTSPAVLAGGLALAFLAFRRKRGH